MGIKDLFQTRVPNTVQNEAGGRAYALTNEAALAQYAVTGCLGQTFYATAEEQVETVLELAENVSDEFLAKTAIYARTRGYMKDMPALLCAILAARKSEFLPVVFPKVIDNGKMLRNFMQIVRSGQTGRKSFGSAVRRLIREWFATRTDKQIFCATVGNTPSMADILRMVHPRPETPQRAALYGYILGKEYAFENLPEIVREYETFRNNLQ